MFTSTITNNRTGRTGYTTQHTTRRAAAQTAAMALHDNNPAMTRAEANKAFGALLDAKTAKASAHYGDYTATVDEN